MSAVLDELLDVLTPEERAEVDEHLQALGQAARPGREGMPAPEHWRARVPMLYPRYASAPMAPRHEAMWEWANGIELGQKPDPFCGYWPRGGAKSTTAEMIVADLGCRGKRKYVLYVRETQEMADKSVSNIATLLESAEIERHFPEHADRAVGKFGNARGWRRNQLSTAGGFTVEALGLDTASRGIKMDERRPDLIVFDDIDGKFDSAATTKKKEETITHSILPAGSNDCAVLFIQNLIIRDGIASRLADGRADYLVLRTNSGPFPAVEGLQYEWRIDPRTQQRRAFITAGTATWAGQPIDACQAMIDTFGLGAFLKECQHKVKDRAEGIALRFEPGRHMRQLTDEQCKELVAMGRVFAGVDFGLWRFAFVLRAVDRQGRCYRIDELFSQKESLTTRAQRIHELCASYGITGMIPIWGDAANPTDILELNNAFRNGWLDDAGRPVVSKLRVVAVKAEHKARAASVEKMNDLLDRNILLYRAGIAYEWQMNMNAGSPGTRQHSSRLLWEIGEWAFPVPKEGEAQVQDPDDDTADGADLIAADRYAVMSWWEKAKALPEYAVVSDDQTKPFSYKGQRFKEHPHAVDLFRESATTRRAPSVRMPRPRTR